ncbi:FecR domain-containing protein [Maribellus sp. YY47]|uniref:FecR family protein n=1 Tax=Maribellus sp. YY47 TaxID=2929486 RepID=UPI002000C0D9|nr:FecR domain-containing protein [Maribellus sp. YY47]MCK3685364.1 FecR domain-containing protein [Maribellus sp. YY47]
MENIENQARELMAKQLVGEASDREKAELEAWLEQAEENRAEWEESRKMLSKVDSYYQEKRFDTNAAWKNVHAQFVPTKKGTVVSLQKKRKEGIATFYKYAAILVVALLLGSVGYYIGFRNQIPAVYSEVISGENQVLQQYVLPDGSVIALNSNSKLTFPKKFKGDVREVSIEGEAFFDVKPNPEKPFVINAGETQVKVLGTSFNVSAYPGDETVEVIVETGKVQVIGKSTEKQTETAEVFLIPGEKGTFFTQNKTLEKSVNADPNFLSWKTHDLIFNKVPLSEVIRCLEKTYHITVDVAEPELNDLLYEGHFDRKPADFVLDVIRLTFNLELTGENEHYTLSGRKNDQ